MAYCTTGYSVINSLSGCYYSTIAQGYVSSVTVNSPTSTTFNPNIGILITDGKPIDPVSCQPMTYVGVVQGIITNYYWRTSNGYWFDATTGDFYQGGPATTFLRPIIPGITYYNPRTGGVVSAGANFLRAWGGDYAISAPPTTTTVGGSTTSSGTSTIGVPSTPITIVGVTGGSTTSGAVPTGTSTVTGLPITNDFTYGIILMDVTDQTLVIPLGAIYTWDGSTTWERMDDVTRYIPFGRKRPIQSYRKLQYWHSSKQFFVPYCDYNGTELVYAKDILRNLTNYSDSHDVLFYRDIDGLALFVILDNFSYYHEDDFHFEVKFELFEVDPPEGVVSADNFTY